MKKVALVILLLVSLAYAKDRAWQSGKLVSVEVDAGSRTPQRVTTWGTVTSYQSHNITVAVEQNSVRYTATKQVYTERDIPLFTENSTVRFVLDKNELIVVDERGKEFKARLAKKTSL
jgi:hypothetical protein